MEYKSFKFPQEKEILIKDQKCEIVCLQEMHIRKKDTRLLYCNILGMEYVTTDERKKRGVVLYVNKNLESKFLFWDTEGRYVTVEIAINQKKSGIRNLCTEWFKRQHFLRFKRQASGFKLQTNNYTGRL